MDHLPLPQEADGIADFRVLYHAEDIVISDPGLLLWCDLVRTTYKNKGKLEEKMTVLVEMTQNIVAEDARAAQDRDEYQKRYDGLIQRYDAAKVRT